MSNVIEDINHLDFVLENPSTEQVQFIKRVLEKPVVRSYLFRKLGKHFDLYWFGLLSELNAFRPEIIPGSIIFKNEKGDDIKGFGGWDGSFVIWEASKRNAENPNFELTKILVKIINNYIDYCYLNIDNPDRNFSTDYYFSQFIFLLPLNNISAKYIKFLVDFGMKHDRSILSGDLTDKFFLRALEERDEQLVYKLLALFFTPIEVSNEYKITSVVDDYYLHGFSNDIPGKLFGFLRQDSIEWGIRKLETLSKKYPYQFLKFNITSLEPDVQNSPSGGLNFALVDLVIGLLNNLEIPNLKRYVTGFLGNRSPIIKRVGYYFIDKNFEHFGDLFWHFDNPLNFFEGKLEIYHIISRHCLSFNKKNIEQILFWVNELKTPRYKYNSKKDRKQYLSYKQVEWLTALDPIFLKNPDVVLKYNQLMDFTNGNLPNHPGYDSYFEVRPGGEYNEAKRILKFSIREVVDFLRKPDEWEGYNAWGLQQDLREYVNNNFNPIIENLTEFIDLPVEFLYNFIDGFRSLAERNIQFNVVKLYDFLLIFIKKRKDLWDKESNGRDRSNSLGMTAWLIDTICENSGYEVNFEILRRGNLILLYIERHYIAPFEWLNHDASFDIINSTRGKIYNAMIGSSLRELKVNPGKIYWNENIKKCFSKRANDASFYPEYFWSVGFLTPQLSYLDFEWLQKYKTQLYTYRQQFQGDPAFYGYLMRSAQLYSNLFQLLTDRYDDQIDVLINIDIKTQRLVEHILVAFIAEEDSSKKLLIKIFERAYPEQINYLVNRILIDKEIIDSNLLIDLWEKIISIVSRNDDFKIKKAVSSTISFIGKLDQNNDKIRYLFAEAVKIADSGTRVYNLMDTILKKLEQTYDHTYGEFVLELLNNSKLNFSYDFGVINKILEILYRKDDINFANTIAVASVERLNFDTVPIYNEFNRVIGRIK